MRSSKMISGEAPGGCRSITKIFSLFLVAAEEIVLLLGPSHSCFFGLRAKSYLLLEKVFWLAIHFSLRLLASVLLEFLVQVFSSNRPYLHL